MTTEAALSSVVIVSQYYDDGTAQFMSIDCVVRTFEDVEPALKKHWPGANFKCAVESATDISTVWLMFVGEVETKFVFIAEKNEVIGN